MEGYGKPPQALRRFGLRIVTLYFTEEVYAHLEVRDDLVSFKDARESAERVVIDDEVVKDRYQRPAGAGAVTVTAPENTVGLLPTALDSPASPDGTVGMIPTVQR